MSSVPSLPRPAAPSGAAHPSPPPPSFRIGAYAPCYRETRRGERGRLMKESNRGAAWYRDGERRGKERGRGRRATEKFKRVPRSYRDLHFFPEPFDLKFGFRSRECEYECERDRARARAAVATNYWPPRKKSIATTRKATWSDTPIHAGCRAGRAREILLSYSRGAGRGRGGGERGGEGQGGG